MIVILRAGRQRHKTVQHSTHCQTSDIKRKKEALCVMSSNRNLTRGLVLSDRSLTSSIGASKNTFKEEEEAVHLHPNTPTMPAAFTA